MYFQLQLLRQGLNQLVQIILHIYKIYCQTQKITYLRLFKKSKLSLYILTVCIIIHISFQGVEEVTWPLKRDLLLFEMG